MDTSRVYIKMSEKAVEVQGRHLEAGDFYARKGCGPDGNGVNVVKWSDQRHISGGKEITTEYVRHNKLDVAWLPRQDQLQEMVIEKDEWITDEIYRLVCDFSTFVEVICVIGRGDYRLRDFKSYEQLWLAFVMREKYGKAWNGEEWVKE